MASLFETLGWLQSLYNANTQFLMFLDDALPLDDEQKITNGAKLLTEILDVIEQLHDNKQILFTDLNQLYFLASLIRNKFKQSLLEDDYYFGVSEQHMIDKLKSMILTVNDKIKKLMIQVENQITQSGVTEDINIDISDIQSRLQAEIDNFIETYNDFKSWYSNGAVIDDFMQLNPEDFDDGRIASEYDTIVQQLNGYKNKLINFIKKLNLTIFYDDIRSLQNAGNNVYKSNELLEYYKNLKLNIEYDLVDVESEDVEQYIYDEFYLALQNLEFFAKEINKLMEDVYLFVTNQWRK